MIQTVALCSLLIHECTMHGSAVTVKLTFESTESLNFLKYDGQQQSLTLSNDLETTQSFLNNI